MGSLFEQDHLVVRPTRYSQDAETVGFTLFDDAERTVGYATQRAGSLEGMLRRRLDEKRTLPMTFDVTDVADAQEWVVDRRKAGRVGLAHRVDVHVAGGELVAGALSGRAAPRTYALTDGDGQPLGTLHPGADRGLVVDAPDGRPLATLEHLVDTLVARRDKLPHEGWDVRYRSEATTVVRIVTLAVALIVEGVLLPRRALPFT